MEIKNNNNNSKIDGVLDGFSPVSAPRIFWKSRRRSASGKDLDRVSTEQEQDTTPNKTSDEQGDFPMDENIHGATLAPMVSERRKALFEPLEPITNFNGKRPSAESLLPPPDFDSASYPKGWLIGKKRKLVNVDVVESMRRIAVQEMNRKDREIDGLNEQLDEDARCLEHLQLQLVQERSKRAEVERENAMLQEQMSMLMNMIGDNEGGDDPDNEP